MNILDRILGRKSDLPVEFPGVTRADAAAVQRYERMLRSAPSSTIEAIHVEAFEKLTPAQLDLLFERFTAAADTDADRPRDARPKTLARSAARAEARKPGAITRIIGSDPANANTISWVGLSILDTIADLAVTSAIWSAWDDGYAGSAGWDDFGDWL